MKKDHYRISPTAILCADARALCTHMPYVQAIHAEVAQHADGRLDGLVPDWLLRAVMRVPALAARAARVSLLEGRYCSTNEAIAALYGERAPILEIASGLSPRGLELSGTRLYLETDLDELIAQKLRITEAVLQKLGKTQQPTHRFRPMNVLDLAQLRAAAQAIREEEPARPFVILHEGLLMYFDDTEQASLRDHIGQVLREFNPQGAWITPDFALRRPGRGAMRRVMDRLEQNTGRKFNCFESDEKVAAFLHAGGLRVEFRPNAHLAANLSCRQKMGLREADLLRHAPDYRAAVITLAG